MSQQIWTLASEVDGVLSVSLHRSEQEVEESIRANFDSEPPDYPDAPLLELVEALEDRDGIILSYEGHDVRGLGLPEINLDVPLLKQQVDALLNVLARCDADDDSDVRITYDESEMLEGIYNFIAGFLNGDGDSNA